MKIATMLQTSLLFSSKTFAVVVRHLGYVSAPIAFWIIYTPLQSFSSITLTGLLSYSLVPAYLPLYERKMGEIQKLRFPCFPFSTFMQFFVFIWKFN